MTDWFDALLEDCAVTWERLTCDLSSATKARAPIEVQAEARLHDEMRAVVAPALEDLLAGIETDGIPTDEARRSQLLADLEERLAEPLAEAMLPEVAAEAIRGWDHVHEVVEAAAAKQLPDDLRPFGMDRQLFAELGGVSDRTLRTLITRTAAVLAGAAGPGAGPNPAALVAEQFEELLEGELKRLSRHVLRDANQTAVVEAERSTGVRYHEWRTSGDTKVRSSHRDTDGEIVAVGTTFSNGWKYPGRIGCRCSVEPVPIPPGWRVPEGRTRFRRSDLIYVDG